MAVDQSPENRKPLPQGNKLQNNIKFPLFGNYFLLPLIIFFFHLHHNEVSNFSFFRAVGLFVFITYVVHQSSNFSCIFDVEKIFYREAEYLTQVKWDCGDFCWFEQSGFVIRSPGQGTKRKKVRSRWTRFYYFWKQFWFILLLFCQPQLDMTA